jgi:hypothetical protein
LGSEPFRANAREYVLESSRETRGAILFIERADVVFDKTRGLYEEIKSDSQPLAGHPLGYPGSDMRREPAEALSVLGTPTTTEGLVRACKVVEARRPANGRLVPGIAFEALIV